MPYKYTEMIQRSTELSKALASSFELDLPTKSERSLATRSMCCIAFEHSRSQFILVHSRHFSSAIALLRPQFESVVRAIWIHYAASDGAVAKLKDELSLDAEKNANSLPMLSEMIQQLEGKAPKAIVGMLVEFKEQSWKALCSFVHGGIHAINRYEGGYPDEMIVQTIRMSNGLNMIAANMSAILTGNRLCTLLLRKIQQEYMDCLPSVKTS